METFSAGLRLVEHLKIENDDIDKILYTNALGVFFSGRLMLRTQIHEAEGAEREALDPILDTQLRRMVSETRQEDTSRNRDGVRSKIR